METVMLSIVFIFFMAGVFFTWFFIHKAKTKERLMLIEKGIDISQLPQDNKFEINFPWLKVGIVIAGMGIGIFIGVNMFEIGAVAAGIFLFGGIGMIIANYLDKPKTQK